MMDELLGSIDTLVKVEKNKAYNQYGPIKSIHEGYGVLAEEVQEFEDVAGEVDMVAMDYLLRLIRDEDMVNVKHKINGIWRYARCASAEAMQVMSVCERVLEAIDGNIGSGD